MEDIPGALGALGTLGDVPSALGTLDAVGLLYSVRVPIDQFNHPHIAIQ